MKKRLVVTLIIICATTLQAFSQEWYPDNATWYYNRQEWVFFEAHGYIEYKVVGDTLIDEKASKVIALTVKDYQGNTRNGGEIIRHEENGKVHQWDGSSFNLIFDFSLEIGGTLDMEIDATSDCISTAPITVDSISSISVNGEELKVQYVSYKYTFLDGTIGTAKYEFIEKVGYEREFTPVFRCGIYDNFVDTKLRCYSDNDILYRRSGWKYSCDTVINERRTEVLKPADFREVNVYPNPASDFVNINVKDSHVTIHRVELYDVYGKKIKSIFPTSNIIMLSLKSLSNGLYFVKVYFNEVENKTFRLIKKS